jgi:hypothetical protein
MVKKDDQGYSLRQRGELYTENVLLPLTGNSFFEQLAEALSFHHHYYYYYYYFAEGLFIKENKTFTGYLRTNRYYVFKGKCQLDTRLLLVTIHNADEKQTECKAPRGMSSKVRCATFDVY